MRFDEETLAGVTSGQCPPTLRFFQFKEPTVSYGKLQKPAQALHTLSQKWKRVVRPTGGGMVFHENDTCISLCWPKGLAVPPSRTQEVYAWIHECIRTALPVDTRMARCGDVCREPAPFMSRECFQEPVGFDLLIGDHKIVGGALLSTRAAVLYQGSIQMPLTTRTQDAIVESFRQALSPTLQHV